MENNSIVGFIPWPVAAATAAWFGFMAWRSGKTLALWAIGGGVLGLVLSTLVLGLAQATFIPFYTGETPAFRLKLAVLTVVVVFCAGWFFTGALHRRLPAKQTAEPPPEPPAIPPAPAARP
jgi:hypothetical protein